MRAVPTISLRRRDASFLCSRSRPDRMDNGYLSTLLRTLSSLLLGSFQQSSLDEMGGSNSIHLDAPFLATLCARGSSIDVDDKENNWREEGEMSKKRTAVRFLWYPVLFYYFICFVYINNATVDTISFKLFLNFMIWGQSCSLSWLMIYYSYIYNIILYI